MTVFGLPKKLMWVGLVFTVSVAGFAGWKFLSGSSGAATTEPMICLEVANAAISPHPGMVWIPSGSFAFGDSVYPEEQPIRKADVTGFWMDSTEVTNAQFAEFVKATGYVTTAEQPVNPIAHPGLPTKLLQPGAVVFISPAELTRGGDVSQWWQYVPGANWRHPSGPKSSIAGRESHPVVSVTVEDAQAYARWKGHELPDEKEWEWAALGGHAARPGDKSQPEDANTWQGFFPVNNPASDGFVGTSPVACFKPNHYGLFDMIGNVWELTSDHYTENHNPQDNVPPDQAPPVQRQVQPGDRHVIKGGSFLCAPNYCMRYRPGARQGQEDDLATSHVGFRTLVRAPGP